jgi:hypothetical protein
MYHDHSARSPGSQRHQQPLHRQPSRQFDAYGPMPTNMYEQDQMRYESARLERLNPSLQNNYGYDISGSQTWNPNGFANAQTLGGIRSASASLKPNARGRAGLPTVCLVLSGRFSKGEKKEGKKEKILTNTSRHGWISNRTCPKHFQTWALAPFRAALCDRKPPLHLPTTTN